MIRSSIKTYGLIGLMALTTLCGSPANSHATLSSSPPVGMGKIVKGCCNAACAYTILGWIAQPKNVTDVYDWFDDTLSDQIEDWGKSHTSGAKQIPPMINKRFEKQNALFRPLLAGYGIAREKSINNKVFGHKSQAYASWDRSNVLIGQGANDSLDSRMRNDLKNYAEGFEKPRDIGSRLFDMGEGSLNPRCIFPESGVTTMKQGRQLLASLKTIVSAFPATKLPESYQDNKGKHYRALRKIQRLRSQVAEAILADVTAGYMPVIPVDEGMVKMWNASGGQGQPVDIKEGRMSPVNFLGFLIRSRFSSRDYRTGENGIHAMPDAGLLRELASVKALGMAVKRRQLLRSQQLAFLAAMQVSGSSAENSLDLEKVLQKVLKEN